MPYVPVAKNSMLAHLVGRIGTMSLHSGPPGNTGANEVTGGSPAYARVAPIFAAPVNGVADMTNDPVFNVPGGITVNHVGFWSNDATPVFLAWDDVTPETFGGQGTYTATAGTLDLNAV